MKPQNLRLLNTLPTLEALICFEAVARCGSFTRASRELLLSQSAVSKQIRSLEEVLRCGLLDRHARGVHLTRAGAAFLEEIEPLLYTLQRAVLRARDDQNSQAVTIACTQAVAHFWLFPRIVRFNQQYPAIAVNIVSANTINERSCGDSDFGILYGDGDWPTLDSTPLFPEIIYPIASAALDVPTPAQPEDLAALPLIQLDSTQWDCLDWQDWFAHFDVPYRIPRNATTFNQVTLSFNAALEGLGVTLGWDFMARRFVESGMLKRVGEFAYDTGRRDFLVHAKYRPLSAHARTFRDWLLAAV
ncbi:LysR substrate-binding domain-containing protein [Burkholderia sp. BCC1977]|uniref:LysR substrate-binding domain-containing protein n=1 Tax=Burkholderia sp. BCC1977 TaxID=2817440 RepID=UPI002ABD5672|nr:LysR substrate-binding domain-containing protein [Burkholderia sp. BCC1977]